MLLLFSHTENKNRTKNNKKERRIKKIIAKSDKYYLLSKTISAENESTKHKKERKIKNVICYCN